MSFVVSGRLSSRDEKFLKRLIASWSLDVFRYSRIQSDYLKSRLKGKQIGRSNALGCFCRLVHGMFMIWTDWQQMRYYHQHKRVAIQMSQQMFQEASQLEISHQFVQRLLNQMIQIIN